MTLRHTVVVYNRHALRAERERAAFEGATGRQILTVEQMAARLAGGFLQPIDRPALNDAVRATIEAGELGVLTALRDFPGLRRALVRSLSKAWAAGLSFTAMAKEAETEDSAERLDSFAGIERSVLARLPASMLTTSALAERALARVHHAPRVLGPVRFLGFTELEPVWRPLVHALDGEVEVHWAAGPRAIPLWLDRNAVVLEAAEPEQPRVRAESCASPRHEVLEAFRWARFLIVHRGVAPHEIAIASVSPGEWDDHVLSLERTSGLPVHFSHGRPPLSRPAGQRAAALAEVLLRGLSHSRLVRLVALLRTEHGPLEPVPSNWWQQIPAEAPLLDRDRWHRALASIEPGDGADFRRPLHELVDTLCHGIEAAGAIGEALLSRESLALWRRALQEGPPQALDVAIQGLRIDDDSDPGERLLWGPADALAAAPRPYVWLVGLTSRGWPRAAAEDPLLPDHIVPSAHLDPLPLHLADRRDFESITRTTRAEVAISRSRRGADGRLLGVSPLYAPYRAGEIYRKRSRVPKHAASEDDRLLARPDEFETRPRARSARQCWRDWHDRRAVTAHDGLVAPQHPVMVRALARRQSASSLSKLLRDPLGYLWRYALRWSEPSETEEVLELDPLGFGTLLHSILEHAVRSLEAETGGFGVAPPETVRLALHGAADKVADAWVDERPAPPPLLWERLLEDVVALAAGALLYPEPSLHDQRSYTEAPFGGVEPAKGAPAGSFSPWDPDEPVVIPGTGVAIGGYIDRIDVAGGGKHARVTDYKSGKPPSSPSGLNGGRELQRCLYAFAVKSLLGADVAVQARLLYPRAAREGLHALDAPEQVLEALSAFVREASELLAAGNTLPGEGAEDRYNDFAFALPAAAASYFTRKRMHVRERLGRLPELWEMP